MICGRRLIACFKNRSNAIHKHKLIFALVIFGTVVFLKTVSLVPKTFGQDSQAPSAQYLSRRVEARIPIVARLNGSRALSQLSEESRQKLREQIDDLDAKVSKLFPNGAQPYFWIQLQRDWLAGRLADRAVIGDAAILASELETSLNKEEIPSHIRKRASALLLKIRSLSEYDYEELKKDSEKLIRDPFLFSLRQSLSPILHPNDSVTVKHRRNRGFLIRAISAILHIPAEFILLREPSIKRAFISNFVERLPVHYWLPYFGGAFDVERMLEFGSIPLFRIGFALNSDPALLQESDHESDRRMQFAYHDFSHAKDNWSLDVFDISALYSKKHKKDPSLQFSALYALSQFRLEQVETVLLLREILNRLGPLKRSPLSDQISNRIKFDSLQHQSIPKRNALKHIDSFTDDKSNSFEDLVFDLFFERPNAPREKQDAVNRLAELIFFTGLYYHAKGDQDRFEDSDRALNLCRQLFQGG
jgi:hypothetical protein